MALCKAVPAGGEIDLIGADVHALDAIAHISRLAVNVGLVGIVEVGVAGIDTV